MDNEAPAAENNPKVCVFNEKHGIPLSRPCQS